MRIFILLFSFITLNVSAQQRIEFKTGTLKEMQALAAQTKKIIFIDCYTSWCIPCKWMEENMFTTKEVASFFNTNFINCKFDMEKGEGREIGRKYKVSSYPVYLFIDSTGEVVHRTGGRMTMEEFLDNAASAVDPSKGSVSVKRQYEKGNRDFSFLIKAYSFMKIDDAAIAKEIAQYFNTNFPAEQFNTSFGWTVIKTFFTSENDRYAQYFVSNRKQLEAIAGKPAIDSFETRMQTTILNRLLQASDEKAFFEKLTYFSQSSDIEKRRSAIVFEADWYNKKRDVEKFNKLMENARNGILKNDADRLAAVARKADYRGLGDPAFRPMCYKLAKQALLLKPDDYGTISTFAYVCLSNKKKEEGLVAAKKAKSIAYTTKVEATMQKVIDELEQL